LLRLFRKKKKRKDTSIVSAGVAEGKSSSIQHMLQLYGEGPTASTNYGGRWRACRPALP